jgi:hypothetical protein
VTSKLASLAEPRHPASCMRVSSSEAPEPHSSGSEWISWIDLRFLMVKSTSYQARSVRLGGLSPFRRGKTMTSFSIKTRTQFRMPATLVRPGSGRWGPSLTAPRSGVQERLSNPSTGQPSNSRSSVCGVGPRVQSREEPPGPPEECDVVIATAEQMSPSPRARGPSSSRLAPEREGQVVVAVPQPPSARAESAVVFLQKEIGGQQYVVRQIPILRKEHLIVYNKKSKSNSF